MALDPMIVGGFRGLELQNPVEAYGNIMRLQSLQQQNELARMQMEQARQEAEVQNRLRSLDPNAPDYISRVKQVSPKIGAELELREAQRTTAERQAQQAQAQVRESNLKLWQSQARDVSLNPSDRALQQLAKNAVSLGLADMPTATAEYQYMLGLPPEQRTSILSRLGSAPAQPSARGPYDRYTPVGRFVFDKETSQFIAPPAVMPSATPAAAPARGPAAPPAEKPPTVKPPTAAQTAKTERMAEARRALSKDIETQLGYYNQLAGIGGMVSPGRSPVANVAAYARSSGLGQEAERALGTSAQTLRDNIKNTRQRLFMQIKDATGATTGQMNSNLEMQAWLDSMTNPQQSIETVRETLKQLDSVIAGVEAQVERDRAAKNAPKKPTAAPTTAPSTPSGATSRREIAPGVFVTERP